jgi:uncharacterized protein YjiS (DUF1127 family)|tara:strand:- start:19 stop:177 length:159 start_codon:yes stop_codon:yes gene_type:complete
MFKKLIKKLQVYQQRRAEYWQLNNLTDQMLKDIGITRGEINYRFYKEEEVGR